MKRFLPATAFVFLAAAAVAQDAAPVYLPPLDDLNGFIVHKERAFFVGAPILISGPMVGNASWSPRGQYLLFEQATGQTNVLNVQDSVRERTPMIPERALMVYSLSSGKSIELVKLEPGRGPEICWIADTNRALLTIDTVTEPDSPRPRQETTLYLLDCQTGTLRELDAWERSQKPIQCRVSPSPTKPLALVEAFFQDTITTRDGRQEYRMSGETALITADGMCAALKAPQEVDTSSVVYSGPEILPVWSSDGTRAFAMVHRQVEGKIQQAWYSVSLVDGSLSPTTRQTDLYMGGEKGGVITVREVPNKTSNNRATQSINAIWLETADPDSQNRLLLAGDARGGAVNATIDCASYISQGSLFVRPIAEVPKKRYEEARVAYNRMQVMKQARENGIALIMYASDYDGMLPTQKQNIQVLLGPYMRDSSLISGFVYTFGGGLIDTISNPAAAQLGYVEMSDGKAVVYADGHVKWVPK